MVQANTYKITEQRWTWREDQAEVLRQVRAEGTFPAKMQTWMQCLSHCSLELQKHVGTGVDWKGGEALPCKVKVFTFFWKIRSYCKISNKGMTYMTRSAIFKDPFGGRRGLDWNRDKTRSWESHIGIAKVIIIWQLRVAGTEVEALRTFWHTGCQDFH